MTCSATLFLPVPAWGAVTAAGAFLHQVLLGLAVALGKSIVYVVLALGGQTLIPHIL